LRAAAERSDRTFAHFVGVQSIDDGKASTLFLHAYAGRRTRCSGRTACTTAATGSFVVLDFECKAICRAGARGFFRAETFFGDFTGLAF